MMKKAEIRHIIFDLGGVLYEVDYHRTIIAFEKLGASDFASYFEQAGQNEWFDQLETGNMSAKEFVAKLSGLIKNTSETEIVDAWNAMLLGMMHDKLAYVESLKSEYTIFLLSNINPIHEAFIRKELGDKFSDFEKLFEKMYFSHVLGKRKPHPETFQYVLEENGLEASETLFIDDSVQHTEGAAKAGLQVHHLLPEENIIEVLDTIREMKQV